MTRGRLLLVAVLGLATALVLAWPERRLLLLRAVAWLAPLEPLSEAQPEGPGVEWFDDYFTVEFIGPRTIAIGEPRYAQENYNYLILGDERAVLFDAGPGVRDIGPVVASLSDLPVTLVPSHLHYDHIGGYAAFDGVALVDLPSVRERARDGVFQPTMAEHLGFIEGQDPPALRVLEWLVPGTEIDLGGRQLEVIHAPGHTPESIVLLDREAPFLFSGDYIYEGPLFAFLPGSSLDDYRRTARALLEVAPPGTRLLTAHRDTPPGAPVLERADLEDLARTLEGMQAGTAQGEGFYVKTYRVNPKLSLVVEELW